MADVTRLKKKAAEYEAKRQYERAIATYEQIARSLGKDVREADVPLFNRLGDLYLRIGDAERGTAMHEKAVDLYAELGFFNNAIALCNKILRQQPNRDSIYYKLGKISAKKGFISDAKQNFLEYSSRMQKAGRMDEAFRALKEFADLCPGQDDVRLSLAEQLLRADLPEDALEQLQALHEQLKSEGRDAEAAAAVERMRAIDPNVEPRHPTGPVKVLREDLIFLDLDAEIERSAHEAAPVEGFEPTSLTEGPGAGEFRVLTPKEFGATALPPPAEPEREFRRAGGYLAGLPLIEDYDARYLEPGAVDQVHANEFSVSDAVEAAIADPLPEVSTDEGVAADTGVAADEDVPADEDVAAFDEDVPADEDVAAFDEDVPADEDVAAFDEDVPAEAQATEHAEVLPIEPMDSGFPTVYEDTVDSSEEGAASVSAVEEQPHDDSPAWSANVDAEHRSDSQEGLFPPDAESVEALREEALPAPESVDTSIARPLEPTPSEPVEVPRRTPRSDDEYVDLGEWLREVQTPRSTRMVTDAGEIPPEGEQADFDEMLEKFKQGLAQNMDAEDYGSHYDLGVAFREMGLLDEAIAQFQKALRGRENRVATYEALGHCFVDKRQYEVAATVLQRALREPGFEDERGLGVLYLLGLANERMARAGEAARYYQRVFSVDINFRDIAERRKAVAQAGH